VSVFAGDCCASVAVLAGLVRRGLDPGVVWIDAHGDFNTPATTVSGYLGGMVLSFITGRGDDDGVGATLGLDEAGVADERVLLVDGRDLDPAERDLLASTAVRRAPIDGVEPGLRTLAATGPLLLHVDLDVVDPSALPGLMFPAAGGVAVSSLVAAVAAVMATERVAAVSVGCTWHPDECDVATCGEVVSAVVEVIEADRP
jgi:arginase